MPEKELNINVNLLIKVNIQNKMKITQVTNTVNKKLPIMKRIKNFFSNSKLKLRTLIADVYECHKTNYVVIDGKKIRERDLPNCVGRPNDYKNLVWKKVKFYPEDEAVMAKMKTAREQIEYASKLIDEGKYIE